MRNTCCGARNEPSGFKGAASSLEATDHQEMIWLDRKLEWEKANANGNGVKQTVRGCSNDGR